MISANASFPSSHMLIANAIISASFICSRRRARFWLLALLLITPALAVTADGAPKDRLVVGSESNFPPFALVRDDGQADGFTVELWQAVAREARLDATIITGPFYQILEQFRRSEIDVLINLAQSDERRAFADFSVPHVRMTGAVFTRKGTSEIKSEDDLAAKSLIVIKADLAHDYARMRGWNNLTLVETAAAGMELLAKSARHDAMLIGRLVGLNTLREKRLTGIEPLDVKVEFQQQFAFAMRKGEADLLARINEGLANVRASGAYDAIYAKWFGSLEPQPIMEHVLRYFLPALLAILVLGGAYLRERSLRMRWKRTASQLDASIAERDLKQAELAEAHIALTNAMPGIARLDTEGRYVSVNDKYAEMLGYDVAELVGTDWARTVADEDRSNALAAYQRMLEVGKGEFEARAVRKDGANFFKQVLMVKIVDVHGLHIGHHCFMRDISERKALEAERGRLATIVERSGDAIVSRDTDLKIITWNAAAERMFGYSAAEIVGRSMDVLNPPDKQALVAQRRSLIEAGGPSQPADTVWLTKQGRRIDVSVVQSPIRDGDGKLLSVALIVRDITERKLTEKSLRLTQFGMDRAADAMFWIGADGAILYANDTACALYGYDRAELLSKSVIDLNPAHRPENWAVHWEQLKQQRAFSYEAEHRTKFGATFDAEVTVNYIEHEGQEYHCTIVRDITARKRADAALRASEEQFRAAFEVSSVGMSQADPATGRLLRVNRRFCDMTGFSEAELLSATFSDITHPDDRAEDNAYFAKLLGGEVESFSLEKRYLRKDGSTMWGDVTVNLIHDGDGVARRSMAVIQDITERKQAELALRASEERYARATSAGTVGVWDLDYRTGVYTTDANLKAMFGYGPDEFDPDPYRWLELVHPDDRTIAMATSQAVVEGRAEKYVCDLRMICKDGSIKWTDVRGDVERAADGSVTRMTGTTVDVTARRRAEDAVQMSERSIRRLYRITNATELPFADRVRALLAFGCERFSVTSGALTRVEGDELEFQLVHAPDGSLAQGARLACSIAYSSAVLHTDEPLCFEHIGASEWRNHPGYLAFGMEAYLGTRIVVNGAVYGTLCFLGAAPHEGSFSVADKDFVKLMAVWISGELERHGAQEQLRKSHDQLRQVIDVDPNFIFAKDREGRFTLVNKAMADAYGTTVENLVGKTDAAFNSNTAEVEFYRQKDLEVMDSLRESFIEEETITDATGKTRWLQTVKRPILDDTGRATQVLGSATDITARRMAEQALRESERDLRGAQSIAHLGSWAWHILDGRNSWSDENYRLLGYEPGTVEPDYNSWFNRIHPDDRAAVLAHLDAVFAGKTKYDIEYRVVPRIGEVRHVHVLGEVSRDSNGTPVRMAGTVLDITERKQAEAALRRAYDGLERRVEERTAELRQAVDALSKTEALLQQAVDVANLGVFERDYLLGEVYFSPTLRKILDLRDDQPGNLGDYLSRVHVEDREAVNGARQRAHAPNGHGYLSMEHRIMRADGSISWVLNRTQTVFEGTGDARRPVRTVGAVLDITERQRSEELLRKNQEWLNQAVNVADLGIFEHDFLTDELSFSEVFRRMLDWPEGLTPTSSEFRRRLHPDDSARVVSAINAAHSSIDGSLSLEYRAVRRDGSIAWLLMRSQYFFDGIGASRRLVRGVGAALDITEGKQAEEALRESEARLRAILDHNPGPVFIKDAAGRYVHVNRQFEELFGLDGQSSIGKSDADLFASEQAETFTRNDRQVFTSGEPLQFEELAHYRDGVHISLVNKFPLRDSTGTVYGLCGIATDITERKAVENALRQLNQELDQRVAQRTRQLAESQAGLRALVAQLTQVEERERRRLAVELHDTLAQSLAVTNMYLWRVRELLGSLADTAAINEVFKSLDRTVEDSIKYTRSLISELSPPVLYDLGLPAAFRWLGDQMNRHGLRVEVDGPAEDFSIAEADAVFLFQCVRELLWNVVKHGNTDCAKIAYGRDANGLSLAVIDNGRGFDLQSARANGDGGNHFGLFSIRERVELRGGRVEIDSAPGAGTWVAITIPTDPPAGKVAKAVAPVSPAQISQPTNGDSIKIVIADDHKMLRQGLRRALEEQGHFVVVGEASDGQEAVLLARQLEPAVVIMDINMPVMNGIEATQEILRARPSTIIIGVSFGTDDYVLQAMQVAGAVTCLPKERAVEDVSKAIWDALAQRRAGEMDNGKLIMEN